MSAPRLAAIAFEHIEAELAVFPFASETSFRLGTSALDPIVSQNDVLWRAAEREIIGALPSLPLDEASSIRDKLWFGSPVSSDPDANERSVLKEPVSLVSYLRRLANTYIDSQGRPIDVSGSEASSDGRFGQKAVFVGHGCVRRFPQTCYAQQEVLLTRPQILLFLVPPSKPCCATKDSRRLINILELPWISLWLGLR